MISYRDWSNKRSLMSLQASAMKLQVSCLNIILSSCSLVRYLVNIAFLPSSSVHSIYTTWSVKRVDGFLLCSITYMAKLTQQQAIRKFVAKGFLISSAIAIPLPYCINGKTPSPLGVNSGKISLPLLPSHVTPSRAQTIAIFLMVRSLQYPLHTVILR